MVKEVIRPGADKSLPVFRKEPCIKVSEYVRQMHSEVQQDYIGYLRKEYGNHYVDRFPLFEPSHDKYNFKPVELVALARVVELLPTIKRFKKGDFIYRGTLLRRLIFTEDFKLVGNEPTEYDNVLNATRNLETAKFYAQSYGDEYAPADWRVDPVIILFDAKKLTEIIPDQGDRWFIPKSILPDCETALGYPGRNRYAQNNLKSLYKVF